MTNLNFEGRNVNALAIYGDVTVVNQLTSLTTSSSQTQTVNHVVQTTFQQDHEVGTVSTFLDLTGTLEQVTELTFSHTVHVTQLLLFAQLHTVFRQAATTVITVITRCVVATSQFLTGTGQRHAETARYTPARASVTRHIRIPPIKLFGVK